MRHLPALNRYTITGVLLGLAACCAAAEPGVARSGQRLLDDLRKGGYVLYFRHTQTLPEHEHEARMRREGKWHLDDCTTQRNLSEAGLVEARQQRDWVKQLGIPFDKAYASRACRTRIHAQTFTPRIEFADALTPTRSREKGLVVRALLKTAPAAGTNAFVFAHGGILWNATDYDSVESETFVFRPTAGDQPPQLVASIKMSDWALLAHGADCCAPRAYWSGKGEPPVD